MKVPLTPPPDVVMVHVHVTLLELSEAAPDHEPFKLAGVGALGDFPHPSPTPVTSNAKPSKDLSVTVFSRVEPSVGKALWCEIAAVYSDASTWGAVKYAHGGQHACQHHQASRFRSRAVAIPCSP
jgi:hypothetical protein